MRNLKRTLSLLLTLAMLLGMMTMGVSAAETTAAAEAPEAVTVSAFADADLITYTEEVSIVAGMGLFAGTTDGKFDPLGTVTRAQMVTVLVKALRGNDFNADAFKGTGVNPFPDTAGFEGGWAEGYINAGYQMGIVGGYGDGTFQPGKAVTTAEALTMIINALGVDAGEGEWPSTVMAKAEAMKLYGSLETKPATNDPMNREQLAVVTYEGICHSPEGASGYKVPGVDIVFANIADAVKACSDPALITEVAGEDTLANKVYELKTAKGYITANQATGMDTTVISSLKADGTLDSGVDYFVATDLDMIGHYVTIYYKEAYNKASDPGLVYTIVDETTVVEVDETIDSAKDYKAAFGKSYQVKQVSQADKAVLFGNAYNYTGAGAVSTYAAGSAAPAGTYFIVDGKIAGYMQPVTVYASQVTEISEYAGEQSIVLADGTKLSNSEGDDQVVEYKGIAVDDYVTYTIAQGVYFLSPVQRMTGKVSAVASDEAGVPVIRFNNLEYAMFTGTNNTGLDTDTTAINFDISYAMYISADEKLIGFEAASGSVAMSDVYYLLGAYSTKEKDKFGDETIYTKAQGVDTQGKEAVLIIGVLVPGEAQLGVAASDVATVTEGFYIAKDHTGKEEKKAGIKVLDDCVAGYDQETNPLFIGTIRGTTASQTVNFRPAGAYHTVHVCTAGCDDIVLANGTSANHVENNNTAYYSSSTVWLTIDGVLGQPLETSLITKTNINYVIPSDQAYKFPFLYSKTADGSTQADVIVMKLPKKTVSGGGALPIYLTDDAMTPVGATAGGYVYDVYDGQTGTKKQIVMKESSLSVTPGFYDYFEEDGVVTLGKEQNYDIDNNLQYFVGHLFDSLYDGQRINTLHPTGMANGLRSDKIEGVKVIDTRTDEEKAADHVDTITSLSRIAALKKSGKVVELSAYSPSSVCAVIYVTKIYGPNAANEVVYLPNNAEANRLNTAIDANGAEKKILIHQADIISGFVNYYNEDGMLKATAIANGENGCWSNQTLSAIADGKLSSTSLTDKSIAADAVVVDTTGNEVDSLAKLQASMRGKEIVFDALEVDGKLTLIVVSSFKDNHVDCASHVNSSAIALTGSETELTSGTYYLTGNVQAQNLLTVKGADVTLCLNGYTLTAPSGISGNFITVTEALAEGETAGTGTPGSLTICGGEAGDGEIDGNSADLVCVRVDQKSSLVLKSGTITRFRRTGNNCAAIMVLTDATFTMNGGAVVDNDAKYGAIRLYRGIITMNDGVVSENNGTGNYGGAFVSAAGASDLAVKIIINGGTISNNTAKKGAIVYNATASSTEIEINGGTFTGNSTTDATSSNFVKSSNQTYAIKGGTYDFEPAAELLAPGYEAVQSGETWQVQAAQGGGSTPTPTVYTVSVGAVSNGTVAVDPASGEAGTTVTVTATPADGYELDKIYVDGSPIDGTTFQISGNHTVSASFKASAPAPGHTNCASHVSGTALTGSETTLSAGTYYLTGDITATSNLTISGEVTLCLNDYTITAPAAGGNFITVQGGAKLTICGGHSGAGVISGNSEATSAAHGILIGGNSSTDEDVVTLNSGTITGFDNSIATGKLNANNGGGVYAYGAAQFIMNGGTISGNAAKKGGAVAINQNATFTMNGGTITNNTSPTAGSGAGVHVMTSNNKCYLKGGSIIGNNTGAWMYVTAGTVEITGGTFDGNPSDYVASGYTATETAEGSGIWVVAPNP